MIPINKRQLEVEKAKIAAEKAELKHLKGIYKKASDDISEKIRISNGKINVLLKDFDKLDETQRSILQSQIYQRNFQQSLKKQIDAFTKELESKQFESVNAYLKNCYTTGFTGTLYDLAGQGVPFVFPIDQKKVTKAMVHDTKLSKPLYNRLGEDVNLLKKRIANNISRGIATADSYVNIARNIANGTKISINNTMRIARTEGHRIQCAAAYDVQHEARDAGADIVKQWDATLDGHTRETHAMCDGEIVELDETFSNGLEYPGDPAGDAEEVINCRCALLQRAKWALDDDELQTLKDRAEYFGLDKTNNFADFQKIYQGISKDELTLLEQTVKISEKKHSSDYGIVDRKLVNSKRYHDKFENLTGRKKVDEVIYQEAMRILEHRDGTPYEDLVAIDRRTGKIITSVTDSNAPGRLPITKKQINVIQNYDGDITLIHNHPNSSRPSYTDILRLKDKNISSVVAVGHDGSVYEVSELNNHFDIEKTWEKLYNANKELYSDKVLADHYTTDDLYNIGAFKVKKR